MCILVVTEVYNTFLMYVQLVDYATLDSEKPTVHVTSLSHIVLPLSITAMQLAEDC